MGYEHREDAMWRGGSSQWQTHTHTHTHIVPRDTKGGWSLGKRLDAILTYVGVAHPLFKLMAYKQRNDAAGGGGSRQWQTHTNTHTHTHTHTHTVPRDTQGGFSLGQ